MMESIKAKEKELLYILADILADIIELRKFSPEKWIKFKEGVNRDSILEMHNVYYMVFQLYLGLWRELIPVRNDEAAMHASDDILELLSKFPDSEMGDWFDRAFDKFREKANNR